MIKVIAGKKGSGKTKALLDYTNQAAKTEHGIVVFIDDDKRYMYDLTYHVRFVDASEYTAIKDCTWETFFGFISGLIAGNYDITLVCIDAFLKLVGETSLEGMEPLFNRLDKLSVDHNVNFVMSLSAATEDLPEFIQKYID